MKRLVVTFMLALASACDGTASDSAVSCKASSDCPFQQCCQSGACVDPGIVGTCTDASDLRGTISFDKSSATAGVDSVTVTTALHDLFGRPLENQAVTLTVSSDCTTSCDSLSPGVGNTDASGHFSSTLTSNIAGTKTITLSVNAGTLATGHIDFVGNDNVIQIGFGGSIFDCPLGNSLGNGRVGIVDASGNFVANPTGGGRTIPVTIALATGGVSIPLVDASGEPLSISQATVDVGSGPVALSDFYVPVAGEHFAVSAAIGTQPAIVSKPFTVSVNSISALNASPNPAPLGSSVTFAWSTTYPGQSSLTSVGLLATASPAALKPAQTATYEASITDNRSTSLRTVALSGGNTLDISSSGDLRLAYVSTPGSNETLFAGDYQGTATLSAAALPPAPAGKSGYTSFIAHLLDGPTVVSAWSYTLSSDDSRITSVTTDATQVYAVAEYTGTATWSGGGANRCAGPSTGAGYTGVILIAIHISDGTFGWCTAFSPQPTNPTSITNGAVAVASNAVYLALNSGPYVTYTQAAGYTVPRTYGSPAVPRKMLIYEFTTSGTFATAEVSIADYPFVVTDLIADQETSSIAVAGGATTSGAQIITGNGTILTTVGQDAVVFGLTNGELQWVWQGNGPGDEIATGIAGDSLGTTAVVGTFSTTMVFDRTFTNADASPDGFVAVLGASTHTSAWARQLHGSGSIDDLAVMANDSQLIVSVTNEGALSVDTAVVGMNAPGAMATAFVWSGVPLSVVPMPGCRGGYAAPTPSGGSMIFSETPDACTINPFDIGGNAITAMGSTGVYVSVVPYDFRQIEVVVGSN